MLAGAQRKDAKSRHKICGRALVLKGPGEMLETLVCNRELALELCAAHLQSLWSIRSLVARWGRAGSAGGVAEVQQVKEGCGWERKDWKPEAGDLSASLVETCKAVLEHREQKLCWARGGFWRNINIVPGVFFVVFVVRLVSPVLTMPP